MNRSWKDEPSASAECESKSEEPFETFFDETPAAKAPTEPAQAKPLKGASSSEYAQGMESASVFQAALKLANKPKLLSAKEEQQLYGAATVPSVKSHQVRSSFVQRSSFPVLPKGSAPSVRQIEKQLRKEGVEIEKQGAPALEFSDDAELEFCGVKSNQASATGKAEEASDMAPSEAAWTSDKPLASALDTDDSMGPTLDLQPSDSDEIVVPKRELQRLSVLKRRTGIIAKKSGKDEKSSKRKWETEEDAENNQGEIRWNAAENEVRKSGSFNRNSNFEGRNYCWYLLIF